MPEHIHLLLSEPPDHETPLSRALLSLKLSVSKRLSERPFWETRYYDFNVFIHNKRVEKLRYMHRNPVTRGLVEHPENYPWSTYRLYLLNEPTPVQITKPDYPSKSGAPIKIGCPIFAAKRLRWASRERATFPEPISRHKC
jgi:putative transposase